MIANDRQTFVAVRKHCGRFLWCFECYAGLTSGECMANGLTGRSGGVANIRNRFLKFARKAYSYCFRKHRNIFLLMARHL